MKITVFNSRKEKLGENKEMSWEKFCDKVSHTKRTSETMAQYDSFEKQIQDDIKDVGGFVAGSLKDNRRKKGCVESRSLITLDMDYGRENILEELEMFFDFACCIYSTHKHRKESPRYRLIIPLSRHVNEKEYEVLSKEVTKEIGEDLFDKSTYEASRLMYWPSTSSDGEFVYKKIDGKLLDVTYYLSKYENRLNSSFSDDFSNNNQEDPLQKQNIVGSFCRAYSISEAIEKFLSDVYSISAIENRYDYIPAKSSAGLVVYDDKFAYSHHSTDIAYGKRLNAFDLVKIHKFSDNKKTSYNDMVSFILKDEKVKLQLIKDRKNSATQDFSVLSNSDDLNWQVNLQLDKQGNIIQNLDNLVVIFECDENLQNVAFNCHRDGIDVRGNLPWEQVKPGWSDSDTASLKVYLSQIYNIYAPAKTKDALLSVAAKRSYHPIREYLDNLPLWDNVKRIDTLLMDYLGAEDNSYTRSVIRKTLIAAVSRIYEPGIKFDTVLILNGPQGIGKSTFFEKLSGNWFSDSLTITDMKDKSGAEKLQGYWILELGELAGMKKMDVETIKSFISRTDDKYRASYGVAVENHPRQCIIVGSTNAEGGFLRDITGNRRFWPVKVSGNSPKKAWSLTKEDVDKIWAEAMYLYNQGEKLYLEGEEKEIATKEQIDAMEGDEREGLVRKYLNTLIPENWDEMDLYERRNFLKGDSSTTGTVKRDIVCNMEIWAECFCYDIASMKLTDSYVISSIMKKIDSWQKYSKNKTGVRNFTMYGTQRCYERILKSR